MSALTRIRLCITVVLLAVPAIFSIVLRVLWQHTPTRIPTHWGGSGPADSFSDASTTWLICLAVAIGAVIAGVGVILLGADILPVRRSLAIGACAAVAGIATALWPTFTLSKLASGGTHHDQIGPEFLLVVAGLVWGALVFLAAGPLTGRGADITVFSRRSAGS